MEDFVFITYILALISLVISILVWFELREMKQERRKQVNKRPTTIVKSPPPKPKPKGIWD